MDGLFMDKGDALRHQQLGLTVSVYVCVLVAIVILAAVVYMPPRHCQRRNRDEELLSLTAHRIS
ncbi:hypothetical protein AALO_G00203010 [Alosa alosa]|uniref:Uncharacterized protein n=1 Tax=Alosa alosa TaxID=278164 RepID=A0AAV6G7Z1_9TELE|nr:hypothetical protein AALO_G00203010 [Alosa alosa]